MLIWMGKSISKHANMLNIFRVWSLYLVWIFQFNYMVSKTVSVLIDGRSLKIDR